MFRLSAMYEKFPLSVKTIAKCTAGFTLVYAMLWLIAQATTAPTTPSFHLSHDQVLVLLVASWVIPNAIMAFAVVWGLRKDTQLSNLTKWVVRLVTGKYGWLIFLVMSLWFGFITNAESLFASLPAFLFAWRFIFLIIASAAIAMYTRYFVTKYGEQAADAPNAIALIAGGFTFIVLLEFFQLIAMFLPKPS